MRDGDGGSTLWIYVLGGAGEPLCDGGDMEVVHRKWDYNDWAVDEDLDISQMYDMLTFQISEGCHCLRIMFMSSGSLSDTIFFAMKK